MKRSLKPRFLTFGLCISFAGFAQSGMSFFNYGDSLLNNCGYQVAIDSLVALEKRFILRTTSQQDQGLAYQALMTFYSFYGDNVNSISYQEKAFPFPGTNTSILRSPIKAVDAQKYILENYSKEPLLMFNEAHNRGQHRAFLRSMLPELYKAGYTYLAMEALSLADSALNRRKYPVKSSGYYIREPAFGQLVRDALALGFILIPYEDTSKIQKDREKSQAQNIFNFQVAHPGAKMIIWAGHDHIYKLPYGGKTRMGAILCDLTGSDIPSFDCTALKEFNKKEFENKTYRDLADSLRLNAPSVIMLGDTPLIVPKLRGMVNACIYLPRTNYDLGYPDWLKESAEHNYILNIPGKIAPGSFVQVYKLYEWSQAGNQAIPVNQFLVSQKIRKYRLFLKKGQYHIAISDAFGKLLVAKKVNVK